MDNHINYITSQFEFSCILSSIKLTNIEDIISIRNKIISNYKRLQINSKLRTCIISSKIVEIKIKIYRFYFYFAKNLDPRFELSKFMTICNIALFVETILFIDNRRKHNDKSEPKP